MADRRISQFQPVTAGETADDDHLPIVDVSAGLGLAGNRRINRLELKRALAQGVDRLARVTDLGPLQIQIDALSSGARIVGEWDAATGAFPTTRPGGGAIQPGDAWIVSGAGTVNGVAFAAADRLVALTATGGATYASHWVRAGYADLVADAVDLTRPYASKAEFLAASIPVPLSAVRVQSDAGLLTYVRDMAGATVHSDGSHWRLDGPAAYPSVAALTGSAYPYDTGDQITVGWWRYRVVAADGDLTTAAGVLLSVVPDAEGYVHVDALGAVGNGTADDTTIIQSAINRYKRVHLGAGKYRVANLLPVSSMRIKGTPGLPWGQSSLFVAQAGASVFFIPSGSAAVQRVWLEDFQADAGADGCTFWNQAGTTQYASTYRIRGLDLSNEFLLLFRSVPIYWLIADCRFGFQGGRRGGTQQFRVMWAWSSGPPINFNRVVDTTHYRCAGANAAQDGAYTLRFGFQWSFENCTAEIFSGCAMVDQREFVGVQFSGGWVENIDYPTIFTVSRDTGAPQQNGSRMTDVSHTHIELHASNQYVIRNISGGQAGLEDVILFGGSSALKPIATPLYTSKWQGVYLNGTIVQKGVMLMENVQAGKITPWRNGPGGGGWGVWTPSGTAPIVNGIDSGYTGEATVRVRPGDRQQCVFRSIDPKLWQHLVAAYPSVTYYLMGYWEVAPAVGSVTLAMWHNQASPTADNVTLTGHANNTIAASPSTNLRSGRLNGNLAYPTMTSLHLGFILSPSDIAVADCWFRVESLQLWLGNQIIDFPQFS